MKAQKGFCLLLGLALLLTAIGCNGSEDMNDEAYEDSLRVSPPTTEELKVMIERAKSGIDKPLVAPREQWPETPPPLGGHLNLPTVN